MHHAPCTIHCSKVDVIEVVWPDGACAVLSASVTIDTLHTVAYPTGSGVSAAACSNVTSANGGAARLLVMRPACTIRTDPERRERYTPPDPMARLTPASFTMISPHRERGNVCVCESE